MISKNVILIVIILLFCGCNSNLENCNCEQIDLYVGSKSLLPFYPLTKKTYQNFDPVSIVDDLEIGSLISKLSALNMGHQEYTGNDHYLLEINCKFKNNLIVQLNREQTKVHTENFETSEELYHLIENIEKRNNASKNDDIE